MLDLFDTLNHDISPILNDEGKETHLFPFRKSKFNIY